MKIKREAGISIQAILIVAICVIFSYVSDASNMNPRNFQTRINMNTPVVCYASFINGTSETYIDSVASVPEKYSAGSLATTRAVPLFVPFYFFGVGFLLMLKKGWIQINRRSYNQRKY